MAERFKALVLKTSVGKLTVGSNPSLSAEIKIPRVGGILILQCMSEIPVPRTEWFPCNEGGSTPYIEAYLISLRRLHAEYP